MRNLQAVGGNNLFLSPHNGSCYDYSEKGHRSKKLIWMVPHVIKYKHDNIIIIWRCNWGNSCDSNCIYAATKTKVFTSDNQNDSDIE